MNPIWIFKMQEYMFWRPVFGDSFQSFGGCWVKVRPRLVCWSLPCKSHAKGRDARSSFHASASCRGERWSHWQTAWQQPCTTHINFPVEPSSSLSVPQTRTLLSSQHSPGEKFTAQISLQHRLCIDKRSCSAAAHETACEITCMCHFGLFGCWCDLAQKV